MSARSRRAEQSWAARYQARVPPLAARLNNTPITPIIETQDAWRGAYEELTERTLQQQRARISEGLQRRATAAGDRAAIARHPGVSLTQARRQWTLVWAYYRAAQLIADRFERGDHAHNMRRLLVRNESILQRLARMRSPTLPRIEDLRGVIVRHETARAALGAAATASAERETPDTWSEQPWFFEARAWDSSYQEQQQILRDRQRAERETRVVIPRPFFVTRTNIRRVVDHILCLRLS
jgi:hypothetical protein